MKNHQHNLNQTNRKKIATQLTTSIAALFLTFSIAGGTTNAESVIRSIVTVFTQNAYAATTYTSSIQAQQESNSISNYLDLSGESFLASHLFGTVISATSSTGTTTTTAVREMYYANPSKVKAKAALVTNLTSGQELFERKSTERLPLASLTKLMTAITVKEMQKNWKTLPTKIKLISNGETLTKVDAVVKSGGYMTVDDLLPYMLLTSSNFAAYSLAHELIPFDSFITYMNFTAKKIGLTNSAFINASGLTETSKNKPNKNSEGSARDVTVLLSNIMTNYPGLARATQIQNAYVMTSSGQKIEIENPNLLLATIPDIVLGKTGFTDDAGGNLAIVIYRNGQYYSIVVLGSTLTGRFEDVAYLASQI